MLRRILLSSAGAVALTGAAFAADLPSHAPPPVFVPPPPMFSWTGIYVGVNAGYHFGGSSNSQFVGTNGFAALQAIGFVPFTGADAPTGAIAGGTIGYNWQVSSFVLGFEVDVDGAGGADTLEGLIVNSDQQLNWLGTGRARIGWAPIERLLIYGTGGVAFGEAKASFSVPLVAPGVSATADVGWTAGGGVEYALPNNWSVKAEYLHYDLGRTNATMVVGFSTLTDSTRHNGNIVRGGLNYKFNWWTPGPVVAAY